MISFLHNYHPDPIIFQFGPIALRWYGLFVVLGISAAIMVSLRLAKKYQLAFEAVFDLAFYLIIGGLIGARIYDVLLQLPYYLDHPWHILQIWRGGLAIHGAIIAGLLIIYFFGRSKKINFFKLTALVVPGLALGQSIGRWGNYFNQELFGLPTHLPWGIPISPVYRPLEHISAQYFHPTFLYESLACLILFFLLLYLNSIWLKEKKVSHQEIVTESIKKEIKLIARRANKESPSVYTWLTAVYVISYSLIRFFLEFIRLDATPLFLGWRWPQIFSLILIIITVFLLIIVHKHDFFEKEKRH